MPDDIRPPAVPAAPPPSPHGFPRVDATFTDTPLHVFPAGPGAWRVVNDFDPTCAFHVTADAHARYRCTCDLAWTTHRGRTVPCRHAEAAAAHEAGAAR